MLHNIKSVVAGTSLSRASIYRLIKKCEFPRPIKISSRRVGWLQADIDRWLEEQKAKASSK
jgi:prophage regulatory protein